MNDATEVYPPMQVIALHVELVPVLPSHVVLGGTVAAAGTGDRQGLGHPMLHHNAERAGGGLSPAIRLSFRSDTTPALSQQPCPPWHSSRRLDVPT